MMFVKLCVILGLMGLVAAALNRLFPAAKGSDEPRSLNDLMREVDISAEARPEEPEESEDPEGSEASEQNDPAGKD